MIANLLLFALLAPTSQPSAQPPIYQMTPAQIGQLLPQWQRDIPNLNQRVVAIARRNLGQPYELYLLGEAPFETIDPQPIYCIEKSDCVVFVEHTLAMALTDSFPQFMAMLQRIRYANGEIGVRTRNHYTEADWNKNNRWLLREITDEIAGQNSAKFAQKVDRAKFFKERYKIEVPRPIQEITESYIPYEKIDSVKSQLRDGDVVNFVSGRGEHGWVGHVGLVALGSDGAVHLIHSAAPYVREEPIEDYIQRATKDAAEKDAAGKARFRGFKFLRLTDDPWGELRKIDGDAAPHVSVPDGAPSFDRFIQLRAEPK